MDVIEVFEEEDLGVESKSLNLSTPVSSVGYSEGQMRLNEKHFINLKYLKKKSVIYHPNLLPELFQMYLFPPLYLLTKY